MPDGLLSKNTVVSRERLRYLYLNGADGDKTFSANGTFDRCVQFYNNLTINSGVTVIPKANDASNRTQYIFVKGTLTFTDATSIIDVSGYGASGGASASGSGAGGNGAGSICIIANTISGAGTLKANGSVGSNGGTPTGTSGTGNTGSAGALRDGTVTTVSGGSSTVGGSGGTVVIQSRTWFLNYLTLDTLVQIYGAGGSSGGFDNDATAGTGAGGGAGGIGTGANSGGGGNSTSNVANQGTGGGGGGGAGLIYIMTFGAMPAVDLQAKGGNGGTPNETAFTAGNGSGAGGGGGGGLIFVLCVGSDSSTKSSAGGSNANNSRSGTSTAGATGTTFSIPFNTIDEMFEQVGF